MAAPPTSPAPARGVPPGASRAGLPHAATALALALAIGAGFALRLAPCLREPGFSFAFDGRYHERLARQWAEAGHVAARDPLSGAPEGRATGRYLPEGLYAVGAAAHHALARAGAPDLRWSLALVQAAAGALVALPAWLAARVVFRDPRAAALAAMLAVLVPVHVTRTLGAELRYDALGGLLAATHAAFAFAALAEGRPRRRLALAAASALLLASALAVWRVSLVVLQIELAAAALRFAWIGRERNARDLWAALALAGSAALLPVAYLSANRFLLSPPWLAVPGLAILHALPARGPLRTVAGRVAVLAAVVALAAVAGWRGAGGDLAAVAAMLVDRLGLGTGRSPDAALMRTVGELLPLGPGRMFLDARVFGWLVPALALLAVLARAVRRPSRGPAPAMGPAAFAFWTLAAGLGVAALMFQRAAVLAAPWLAVAVAGVSMRVVNLRGFPRAALAALALAAFAGTGVWALRAARAGAGRPSASLVAATAYLREHAAPGTIVLCDWDAGYEVQARTGHATVMDGMLESEENRRRIREFYGALMDPAPGRLEAMARRHRARWLVLPGGSAIYAMAVVTGDPLAPVLARGEAVPRGPLTDHLIVRLIEGEPSYPGLRRAFEAGGLTVFEFTPAPR